MFDFQFPNTSDVLKLSAITLRRKSTAWPLFGSQNGGSAGMILPCCCVLSAVECYSSFCRWLEVWFKSWGDVRLRGSLRLALTFCLPDRDMSDFTTKLKE
ncbi:MAG: hypothetical protein ACKESB_00895 [Candidatus Hodgkinia cicadicola]